MQGQREFWLLWKRGRELGEGDGGVHRKQNITVARGNAWGFPEGLEVLYQQSPAIYHLWKCDFVRMCVSAFVGG